MSTSPNRDASSVPLVSIEVMPRTARGIESFRDILPGDTRLYIAHIEGTRDEDMIETARRILGEGFSVMPHIPARLIRSRVRLESLLSAYAREGVQEALVIGGGKSEPAGSYASSMELLDTGLFSDLGFRRVHVAGHPEGNKDISSGEATDPGLITPLAEKLDRLESEGIESAIVTQFLFEAAPLGPWIRALSDHGIRHPVHVGIPGPANLASLMKFAIACGVGPSIRVLERRMRNLGAFVQPYHPDDLIREIRSEAAGLDAAGADAAGPEDAAASGPAISGLHVFPLGGIARAAALF